MLALSALASEMDIAVYDPLVIIQSYFLFMKIVSKPQCECINELIKTYPTTFEAVGKIYIECSIGPYSP